MSIIKQAFDKVKPENRQFVAKSKALADEVCEALRAKDISQKEVAEKLGKQPSEISKWLSGMHNPTLRTVTTLEVLLGTDLLITPAQAKKQYGKREYVYMKVHASSHPMGKRPYTNAVQIKRPAEAISKVRGIKAS